jgi:hypothetical protein
MREFKYKFALAILLRKLSKLTVAEAQWLVRLYHSEHVAFNLRGENVVCASSAKLCFCAKPIKTTDFASDVKVWFYGGPPGQTLGTGRAYYAGTFVTFILDQIMLQHAQYGTPLAWLVRFNPDKAEAIWTQLKERVPLKMRRFSTHPKSTTVRRAAVARVGTDLVQLGLFKMSLPDLTLAATSVSRRSDLLKYPAL